MNLSGRQCPSVITIKVRAATATFTRLKAVAAIQLLTRGKEGARGESAVRQTNCHRCWSKNASPVNGIAGVRLVDGIGCSLENNPGRGCSAWMRTTPLRRRSQRIWSFEEQHGSPAWSAATPVERLAHSAGQAQADDSNGLDTNVTSQNTGSNTVIIFFNRPMPI